MPWPKGVPKPKEFKKRVSDTLKKKVERGELVVKIHPWQKGKKPSVESIEKNRESNKALGRTDIPQGLKDWRAENKSWNLGLKMSDEFRKGCRERNIGKILSNETRRRISESRVGTVMSEGQKLKLSKAQAAACVRGRKGKVMYAGVWMQNDYEVMFAKWCDANGVVWKYEPVAFECSNGRHYIPDFGVGSEFVEVKGWLDKEDALKMNEFVAAGNKLYFVKARNFKGLNENAVWRANEGFATGRC